MALQRYPGNSFFVPAAHYTDASRTPRAIRRIVLHSMEMEEGPTTALKCLNYFHSTTKSASSHFCTDNQHVGQGVGLEDVAWAAPGCNSDGVQIEQAGFAAQTAAEWKDAFGLGLLQTTGGLVAWLCTYLSIPPVYIDRGGLLAGKSGITTHVQVSLAYRRSDHTDPGKYYPMGDLLAIVRAKMGSGAGQVVPSEPERWDPITVGGITFCTKFAKWLPLARGQKFWAETVALQHALNGYITPTGLPRLVVDGDFGGKTETFLRAWQRWIGLPQTGVASAVDAKRLGLTN